MYNHIPDCPTIENLILGVRWSPAPSWPGSKKNILHNYCTPPMGPMLVISIFFKQAIYGIYGLMSVTYLPLGKTFGRTLTFCFCQFEISTLRSSTCSFCLFLSLVILLHVRKYLYVPNSLIIYPRTFQKKSQKKHLSIDRSIHHSQGVLERTAGWTPRAFCSLSVEERNTPGKHLV